ncbi:MAG: S41 family peptidase [Gemmatimonadetes bacterium]|nr:S41 family peptidase [Gemmatimonadota bacterium]MYG86420.1 S41 family peptidase [Gemmatimonadota bacterium]MYJ89997.1 S41 family peptidase [Gemmatimonadota bacterium]
MWAKNRKITLALLVVIGLLGTVWVIRHDRAQAVGDQQYDLKLLQQVVDRIRAKYVDDLNEGEAIDAAIRGMLGTLDPYTEFLAKKQSDEMKMMQIQGKYGGLGIRIQKQENALVVVALFDDTPAFDVGLQTGDRIVRIEESSTADIDVSQAADLLRGSPGTSVKISVSREGEDAFIDFTVTRAIITIPVVPYVGMLEGDTGYIKLNQFTEDASIQVEQALKQLQAQGAGGYLLDLRGNPGGLLEQAVDVAGKFLPEDRLIVYTMGRPGSDQRSYHAPESYTLEDAPLVVLVDRFSASASEIVAGAIQDWDRGVVAGQPTFGKASVQQIFPMNQGTALKITTARYYTPSGRLIQKTGERTGESVASDSSPGETDGSDRTSYETRIGRTVYGGGGIAPDVEIEVPAYPNLIRALNNQSMFIKFAIHYVSNNPEADPSTFDVTDEMINAFRRFVETRSFTYASVAEQSLDELEEIVRDRAPADDVMESLADLRGKLNRQRELEYSRHRDLLVARIGTEISAKLWGTAGRYAFAARHDPLIRASLEILNDEREYRKLLGNDPAE